MRKYAKEVAIPGVSAQDIYRKITRGIDSMLGRMSIRNLDVTRNDDLRSIDIKSSHVSGTLICDEGIISVKGKLSLIAGPFRLKMDNAIENWVSRNFAIGDGKNE
ncbi:MAG: hypothetical protein V3S89_03515 [Desulfobacterales bacterium]